MISGLLNSTNVWNWGFSSLIDLEIDQDNCNGLSVLLTVQETRSIHDSMNRPKMEFITYIYILYYQSSIKFQDPPYSDCLQDILK